jgi:glycine amidinotransferase
MPGCAVRVDAEWATLREVVVGRPFYRIPKPFPEDRREGVDDALWMKVKAREGQTMRVAMPREYRRCATQMDRVVDLLAAEGVRVHRVPRFAPAEEAFLAVEYPESIQFFPRDPVLVAGHHVVELCLRDARRRRERAPWRRLLRHRGIAGAVLTMPFPEPPEREDDPWAYLEGGDCLVNGDEILVGRRPNGSSAEGVDWLRDALRDSHRVTPVPLATDFAHLDLALSLVRPGLGIVCREALPEGLPASLRGWNWIEVTRDEALRDMATNGLQLDARRIVMPARATRVSEVLIAVGHIVIPVEFDTVTAFNGGLRCWSHPLARWD